MSVSRGTTAALSLVPLSLLVATSASSHELGSAPSQSPTELALTFSFEPWVIGPLVVVLLLYFRGRQAFARRGHRRPPGRDAFFVAGWLTLAVALVSPLDALSEASFTAHMVQHLLLLLVAPPLLLAARPLSLVLQGAPSAPRRAGSAVLRAGVAGSLRELSRRPVGVLLVHGVVLWGWHAPRAYDAALQNDVVHAAEHGSFVVAGLLFWRVLSSARAQGAVGDGGAVLFVFLGAMQGGVLGALLTVAQRPLYESHLEGARLFGLTALEDQQLAGLLMWVPSGILFAAVAVAHGARLLARCDGVEGRG